MNRLSLWWALTRLKFGRATARSDAAMDLGRSDDARAVKPLMRLLLDKKGWRTEEARDALEMLGTLAVEPLRMHLQHEEATVRCRVIRTLFRIAKFKGAYDGAVTDLLAALKDQDSDVRCEAVNGLAFQVDGEFAVRGLLAVLNDREPKVRQLAAVRLLERLGKTREPLNAMLRDKAFKGLLAALIDDDGTVRLEAAKTLADVMGELAIDPLGTLCRDKDYYVCKAAVESLIKIGIKSQKENSSDALQTLNRVFKSLALALDAPEGEIRQLAAAALYGWRWKPVKESHRLLLLEIAENDRNAKGPEGTLWCSKCERWRKYYDAEQEYAATGMYDGMVVSIRCSTCRDRLGGHALEDWP